MSLELPSRFLIFDVELLVDKYWPDFLEEELLSQFVLAVLTLTAEGVDTQEVFDYEVRLPGLELAQLADGVKEALLVFRPHEPATIFITRGNGVLLLLLPFFVLFWLFCWWGCSLTCRLRLLGQAQLHASLKQDIEADHDTRHWRTSGLLDLHPKDPFTNNVMAFWPLSI